MIREALAARLRIQARAKSERAVGIAVVTRRAPSIIAQRLFQAHLLAERERRGGQSR